MVLKPAVITLRATLIYLFIYQVRLKTNTQTNLLIKDIFFKKALYQHTLPFFSQFIETGEVFEVIRKVPSSK